MVQASSTPLVITPNAQDNSLFTTPYFFSLRYNHDYINFIINISTIYEPPTYHQARENNNWITAIQSELAFLEKNNTWVIITLSEGKKAIACKWVYKVKYKADRQLKSTRLDW